ncbi:ATP-binding protein [Altericroceibacterium endophyticum]|uniref:histidine kinase n=1 Tax=Altericroceibacterium endophyticum TaxID=1808508 RepID=A0A6I4T2U4_9SPHN|nr:ATP-binding protein [Altericroceibacterium endophyticum]MXO65564.1 response regulator [Altericroceibacterium endophyticum]
MNSARASESIAALKARIAELEAAQAKLTHEKAAAEAANEAKSRFLANVSHEIRSPLNSIYGYAQLLERQDGRDAVHAAKIIRRSSEHLTNLVEGLLDLSQVESGILRLSRDVIRFPALLSQMVDMFEPQARARGLQFHLERPDNLPEFVRGDQKRLRQVLINLIANAVKFTAQGHVTLRVHYRSELATFEIDDSGIGIAADDLERIFDPFEQGAEGAANGAAGVGLGLSITQALVSIMGGEISVQSSPGKGTCFSVRLMLSQPMTQPADRTPAATVSGYVGPRRRIMVVDDDPAQRAMLRSLLEPLGFEICEVSDGDSAIAQAARDLPDLIFLDITMPGRSGWETARGLRDIHGSDLRIVMLSADAHERRADDAAGNDMFVAKPFEFSVLLDVISAQLRLQWTKIEDDSEAATKASPPHGPPPWAEARPHLNEIERLVRMGDVRGIENEIDAIARLQSGSVPLIDDMRNCLDCFDLQGLVTLAKGALRDAG